MDNHNKENFFPLNSSTYIQDDTYQTLNNMNKTESDIQAQAQKIKDMEAEHMITKELILGHE